ncbi:MAG: hypothetical protein F6K23_36880 [Okeania sp. SIO2C9]|uniref:hypothetical protein n=1 Tax=Okeania sp. SIO2C9 TaxID=2607791 RepID=UPI0013BFF3AD|nr:hypothetical protein [Okeania sp. SIO2C9]NEQ78086.1 hypothetical protein [Okeania sp. SIO2C9]
MGRKRNHKKKTTFGYNKIFASLEKYLQVFFEAKQLRGNIGYTLPLFSLNKTENEINNVGFKIDVLLSNGVSITPCGHSGSVWITPVFIVEILASTIDNNELEIFYEFLFEIVKSIDSEFFVYPQTQSDAEINLTCNGGYYADDKNAQTFGYIVFKKRLSKVEMIKIGEFVDADFRDYLSVKSTNLIKNIFETP